jgi:DNA-binding MarR family transcriptional regulator
MLALYEHDPRLNRLLQEAARNILFVIIMCLNARCDQDDRATWPTMQLVARTTAAHRVASERRIHGLVTQFVRAGYIELKPSDRDRRDRLVTPTAKMVAEDQVWLVSHYMPLQVLFPDPGYDLIMRRDPKFQIAQRLVASSFLAHGVKLLADHELIVRFMMREAGMMTLLKLLALDRRDALKDGVSYADIGARFGASRTQVRKIVQEAASVGFLYVSKDDRPIVRLTAKLFDAFDRFTAAGMSGHDLIYRLAVQTMA